MINPIATALESIFKCQTCQRCEDVVLSAVNEIEVITLERDKARHERDELRQQVENIKNGFEGCCNACEPVGEMNKKLREERDEARKQICESHSRNCHQAYQHAIECNWDCYKETP